MTEVQVGLALLATVSVVWALMWWGWRARVQRQHVLPAPEAVPDMLGPNTFGATEAAYIGTTTTGDWLDRVVAAGLGARSAASVSVHGAGAASGVLRLRRETDRISHVDAATALIRRHDSKDEVGAGG